MQSEVAARFDIFPWNKNFETGITSVDKQHRRLVNLLNELSTHLGLHSEHIELDKIFSDLTDYAKFHFKAEEAVWHTYFDGGEWFVDHRNSHDSFMANVTELKRADNLKSLDEILLEVLHFLTRWLVLHILDSDMRMAKALNGMKSGLPIKQAEMQAELEMKNSMTVLIETVLNMYSRLYTRSLGMMWEREQQAAMAHNALVGVVGSVSKALEARDPYTAGHQQRVARIAVEIAERMGLEETRIEGIRLGASIHDIGKLAVPVDLLTKPTQLNELEYAMIRSHAQRGLEILNGVSFPWPIAEIVSQHHERMDGSGYPNGLKGNEIVLEVRIVSVADVFEAMTAHRPYRASLGDELAVDELKKNRGTLYDVDVVDALFELLEEGKLNSLP